MEIINGTETNPEYLPFELAGAAKKLVQDVMLVKPGENVLITADSKSDWRAAMATAQAAYAAGATPTMVWYPANPRGAMEPPRPVAGAIAETDVWIEFPNSYLLYSAAQKHAKEMGVRFFCGAGLHVEAMVTSIGSIDYVLMLELGDKLCDLTNACDEYRLTDPNGMDVVCHMHGTKVEQWGGLGDKPGAEVMLGGQVGWLPNEASEASMNGTIVFDGMVFPPIDVGPLKANVTLQIEKGAIVKIEGGAEAGKLEAYLAAFDDLNMYRIAHYTYGFNPGVHSITGGVDLDERVFGSFCFGCGSRFDRKASGHFDGVTLRPSVYLDGKPIEVEGKYVHPELVEICERMGVEGY
jgi:leucyl aminopeptidase (aminopeptidase T)